MSRSPYVKNFPVQPVYGYAAWTNEETGNSGFFEGQAQTIPGRYDIGEFYPEWRDAIARGANAATDREASKVTLEVSPGYLECRSKNGSLQGNYLHDYSGYLATSPNIVVQWLNLNQSQTRASKTLSDLAIARFAKNGKDVVTQIESGEMLAEARESATMLRSQGRGLIRELLRFVKGETLTQRHIGRLARKKPRKGQKSWNRKTIINSRLKSLGENWLGFNYGVKPLVSDIMAAHEALTNFKVEPYAKAKGTAKIVERTTSPLFGQRIITGDTRSDTQIGITEETTHRVKYYGMFRNEQPAYEDKPSILPLVSHRSASLGVALNDFLPSLWEGIPYSFLLDYFSNAGDLIRAKTTLWAYMAWVSRSERNKYVRRVDLFPALGSAVGAVYISSGGYGGNARLTRNTLWRDKSPSVDMSFHARVPPMDSEAWLNVAALALAHSTLKSVLIS